MAARGVFVRSLAGAVLSCALAVPALAGSPCGLPDQLLALPGRLDVTLARIAADAPLKVLAIGSSSTEGVGASSPQRTYPARFKAALEKRVQGLIVEVTNRGVGGEVVEATIARMHREVEAIKPHLVIWQLGTNDALRGGDPEGFFASVRHGLDWLAEHKVDVVLMTPQRFPRIYDSTAYVGLVDRLAALGERRGVPVLRRFAAMAHWQSLPDGIRKTMLWNDNFHMNDQGYACVGEMAAEVLARRAAPILAARRTARPAATAAAPVPNAPAMALAITEP